MIRKFHPTGTIWSVETRRRRQRASSKTNLSTDATHAVLLRTIPLMGEEGDKVATRFDTSPCDVQDLQHAWRIAQNTKSYHFPIR